MTPTEFCNIHRAYSDIRAFAEQFSTMTEVWDNCSEPSWMHWILRKQAPLTRDQAVHLIIAHAETVLHLVPEGEDRPRRAVEAAKAWLSNPCDETAEAARAAAWSAAGADAADAAAADWAAWAAARAAWSAAEAAEAAEAAWASDSAAEDAAWFAARTAALADTSLTYKKALAAQCDIIRSIIPNPFT